jgi:uncharacterized protein (TIGR02466 family)
MSLRPLFVTHLYQASLADEAGFDGFRAELEAACQAVAERDEAGRAWCRERGYGGYTSYASVPDLAASAEVFARLKTRLDAHADACRAALGLDLEGLRLELSGFWINILPPGEGHSSHLHPYNVLSGTFYVASPPGADTLKLEDPRLPLMMSAPARTADAAEFVQPFVYVRVAPGTVLLWESWLRHEVPPNRAATPRMSVSFNYRCV